MGSIQTKISGWVSFIIKQCIQAISFDPAGSRRHSERLRRVGSGHGGDGRFDAFVIDSGPTAFHPVHTLQVGAQPRIQTMGPSAHSLGSSIQARRQVKL